MEELNDQIKIVEAEILECRNKLNRKKKRIPLLIFIGIALSFIFPYLPGRRGRRPMIEFWEYHYAVLFCAVIIASVLAISYSMDKTKLEKNLRALKLRKYLIEQKRQTKH